MSPAIRKIMRMHFGLKLWHFFRNFTMLLCQEVKGTKYIPMFQTNTFHHILLPHPRVLLGLVIMASLKLKLELSLAKTNHDNFSWLIFTFNQIVFQERQNKINTWDRVTIACSRLSFILLIYNHSVTLFPTAYFPTLWKIHFRVS